MVNIGNYIYFPLKCSILAILSLSLRKNRGNIKLNEDIKRLLISQKYLIIDSF